MKRTISLIFLLLVVIYSSFAQIKITTDAVNFRTSPSTKGNVICTISKGTQVEVIQSEINGEWEKVTYNNKSGYVNSKYLSAISIDSKKIKKSVPNNSISTKNKTKANYSENPKPIKAKQSSGNNSSAPSGATAECNDGTYSYSNSRRGTCSHHGGVKRWLK